LSKSLDITCTFLCSDSFEITSTAKSSSYVFEDSDPVSNTITVSATKISKRSKSRKKLTPEQRKQLEIVGELWHKRMGHISAPYVNRLPTVTEGIVELLCSHSQRTCEPCVLAKMKRKPYNKTRDSADKIGQIVHADLIGEISPVSAWKPKKYILVTIDDFSRYMQIRLLKSKTETPSSLDIILREIQARNPGPGQLDKLYCDQGPEFISEQTKLVLDKYGMTRQYAEAGVHEHSGTVERANLTLEERIRALLIQAGFPNRFWNFAATSACYLYNRTPHSSLGFFTPYEFFYGKKPNIDNICIFGSRAFVHDQHVPRSKKAKPRATQQYLVGFTPTGYITCNPSHPKPQYVCDVIINEEVQYKGDVDISALSDDPLILRECQPGDETETSEISDHNFTVSGNKLSFSSGGESFSHSQNPESNTQLSEITVEIDDDWDEEMNTDEPDLPPIEINTVSFATDNGSKIYDSYGSFNKDLHMFQELPLSYESATTGPEASEWIIAINEELEALTKFKVWEIVSRQPGMKVIPVRWVFTVKETGKKKARLVVVGCRDPETNSYTSEEKASPTPSASVIRWFLAHAVHEGWNLLQIDVINAFLHSPINREKYVQIPPGISTYSKMFACKLNKSLYMGSHLHQFVGINFSRLLSKASVLSRLPVNYVFFVKHARQTRTLFNCSCVRLMIY
jgi:hypothetical protein